MLVFTHFLSRPFSVLHNPDNPPLILQVENWMEALVGFEAPIYGFYGTVLCALILAALLALRGVSLSVGTVVFALPMVCALALNEWITLSSGITVPLEHRGQWLFQLARIFGVWILLTTIAHGSMLIARDRWRLRKARDLALAQRRAELLASIP